MLGVWQNKAFIPVLTFLSVLFYGQISYVSSRHDGFLLLFFWSILFLFYLLLISAKHLTISKGIAIGLLFKLIIFFSIPSLSDDYFRFIWDGTLLLNGINPFSHLPQYYLEQMGNLSGLSKELYEGLNSKEYFTIYPPLNQLVFLISAWLGQGNIFISVLTIRFFLLLADVGVMLLLRVLLKLNGIDERKVLWYALNPLIIMELIGNLHFEAFMIFFLLLGIYFSNSEKMTLAGSALALSIASKLLPLMFLPLWLRKLRFSRLSILYVSCGFVLLILFVPILNPDLINGMRSSLGLYFQHFEFNASFYFVARWVGYQVKGYNMIANYGPFLAQICMAIVLLMAVVKPKQQLEEKMLWSFLAYLLLSTTVHPWYISMLFVLSLFTKHKFALVWTYTAFFSYVNYTVDGYQENLWVIALEYLLVLTVLLVELFYWRRIEQFSRSLNRLFFKR